MDPCPYCAWHVGYVLSEPRMSRIGFEPCETGGDGEGRVEVAKSNVIDLTCPFEIMTWIRTNEMATVDA